MGLFKLTGSSRSRNRGLWLTVMSETEETTMILRGAVVNFLGDSITEGAGASAPEKGFVPVLGERFGLKRANNYGIGGTRIARQPVPTSGNERYDLDFCMRCKDMDPDADAVVIFGGTNDYGHGLAPVGTLQDRTPDTFCGACHTLMQSVIERWLGKPIVVCTPLHRLDECNPRGDGSKPDGSAPLKVYRDLLIEIAQWYALPVLDLYSVSGLQPEVPAVREYLMPDGLHPSDAGHAILAERIGAYLLSL